MARRQLDKFKAAELCNLVWGLAQLGPHADTDLLQEAVQVSEDWAEVSPSVRCVRDMQ